MDRNTTTIHRDGLSLRSSDSRSASATTSSEFVLQWGNRKKLRCMKVQAKVGGSHSNNAKSNERTGQRAAARIDRRVVRSDLNKDSKLDLANNNNHQTDTKIGGKSKGNGYINLRQRPASPSHRILRNSESSIGMRGHSNGVRGLTSPDRANKKSGHYNKKNLYNINDSNHQNDNTHHHQNGSGRVVGSGSSETTHDGIKGGGSSPGGDAVSPFVWPPKFVIALSSKEKEEDFLAIKGSKLPQRPKKRAKMIQRTVNLVCPGTWLCDLTLERYEVIEKKVSKKRPRGLKAMGNMDSDSD